MNRLKLIAHKWYVFFVTLKNALQFIFAATDRIAGLKIVILTEQDLDKLDDHQQEIEKDEIFEDVHRKDLN